MSNLYRMYTNERLARSFRRSFINVSMLPEREKDKRVTKKIVGKKKKTRKN